MVELPIVVESRRVVKKQLSYTFYPPLSYVVSVGGAAGHPLGTRVLTSFASLRLAGRVSAHSARGYGDGHPRQLHLLDDRLCGQRRSLLRLPGAAALPQFRNEPYVPARRPQLLYGE